MVCELFIDGAVQVGSTIHTHEHLVRMCVPGLMYVQQFVGSDYGVINHMWGRPSESHYPYYHFMYCTVVELEFVAKGMFF